jgi:CRP-like cAMP-binding protein
LSTNMTALKGIYLFKEFDEKEMQAVALLGVEKTVTAGEEFFSAGQPAECFFVIQMGSVKIFSNLKSGDAAGITQMGSGSHFGELAFFDDGKRSATAQAVETCRIVEIPFKGLKSLLEFNPNMAVKFYRSCARLLASRLRATTDDLTSVKESKLRLF